MPQRCIQTLTARVKRRGESGVLARRAEAVILSEAIETEWASYNRSIDASQTSNAGSIPIARSRAAEMASTNIDPAELMALALMPAIVAAIFRASAWVHYRQVNRDRPLSAYQRRLTKYGTLAVFGAGYTLILPAVRGLPKPVGILLTTGWVLAVWTLYRRRCEQDLAHASDEFVRKTDKEQ